MSGRKCTIRCQCTCRSASAYLGHTAGAFPESERAAKETLALPIYPELLDVQARFVVESIQEFYTQLQAPLLASESVARSASTQPRAAAE